VYLAYRVYPFTRADAAGGRRCAGRPSIKAWACGLGHRDRNSERSRQWSGHLQTPRAGPVPQTRCPDHCCRSKL